ncbi:MAG: efflux RND transporter periplasmic adaptor subunit [Planctomycetota bacterium]|nr:efflux RND transporter periplasmic adaptor subunit [Planctomycetota bacterium]
MSENQSPLEIQPDDSTSPAPDGAPSPALIGEPARAGAWRGLLFAVRAVEIRLRFVAILVGIGLLIGYWDAIRNHWDKWTRPAAGTPFELVSGQEFYCPMHPSVVRDKPDPGGATPKCPICGMPLSKRTKGEVSPLPEGVVSRVQLSPYRVQLAGIETAEVTHRPLVKELRTVGFVTFDESRLTRLVVRVAGYLEKLHVNKSFAEVREGEPLAEIYSPDLYNAMRELLITRGDNSGLSKIAHERLRLLGIAEQEIDDIEKSGQAKDRLIIRAPRTGHVFQKEVIEGDRLEVGQMLFEVADLTVLWIEAEVYEEDAALIRPGQDVEATLEGLPGHVFAGKVGLVHPHVETATRTIRVRFELENPGHLLKPGMYATVLLRTPVSEIEPFASIPRNEDAMPALSDADLIAQQKICPVTGAKLGSMGQPIRASVGERIVFLCCAGCPDLLKQDPEKYLARLSAVTVDGVLAVPESAVIDTGDQQVVYIERTPGLFEGVAVTLGPRAGGYYSVMEGLLAGDRVAAAGAFLVDAETRLHPAAAGAYFGASKGAEK